MTLFASKVNGRVHNSMGETCPFHGTMGFCDHLAVTYTEPYPIQATMKKPYPVLTWGVSLLFAGALQAQSIGPSQNLSKAELLRQSVRTMQQPDVPSMGPSTGAPVNAVAPQNLSVGGSLTTLSAAKSGDFAQGSPLGDHTVNYANSGGGPPNDDCTGAVPQNLAPGATVNYSGNNTGATVLEPTPFVVVWEAFTTTECTNVTVNYCVPGSVFANFLINIVTQCPDPLGGVLTGTFTDCTVSFAALPAGTYWIPVLVDPPDTPNGNYSISVSATSCAPPDGDCTGAVPQALAAGATVTFTGDNSDATVLEPTAFLVVWQAFTTTECTNVTVNYCVPGSIFANFLINIVNQCPDPLGGVLTGTFTDCTVSFAELPAGTYWIPVLTDPPDTPDGAYTISVSATACAPPPPGYCPAGATSTDFEKIGNVTFAGINNNSTSTAGYEDFTNVVGAVEAGANYPISVTIEEGYPEDQIYVWIDWDQNEVFEVSELMWVSPIGAGPTHSGSIAVPAGALAGSTRMRVRLTDTHDGSGYPNNINAIPCGLSSYGQVEDYTINVTSGGGGGYCNAGADGTGLGLEERIINVTFAGIDHDSPNVSPTAPAYSDFTAVSGTAVIGQTYPIAVDVARNGANTSYNTNQVLVWIDLNHDEDFLDPGELVYVSEIASVDIYTGNVTIPMGSTVGPTRMRIRLHDTHDGSAYTNNFNDTPCGLASYGEVEDYTVIIETSSGVSGQGAVSWSVFPNPNTGDFTVRYGGLDAQVAMEVIDVTGRLVHNESRWMVQGELTYMALSGKLSLGSYIVRFSTNDASYEQRIVVQ